MVPPKLTDRAAQARAGRTSREETHDAGAEPAVGGGEVLAHEGWRGLPPNIAQLPSADRREQLRILEALLFAASEPLAEQYLRLHLKSDDDVAALLERAAGLLCQPRHQPGQGRGQVGVPHRRGPLLPARAQRHRAAAPVKAAMETLAIIAYHQPVTRAEIEEIRGVVASAGTLDVLMEIGWVRPRGRRRAPGRPITYGTTEEFLDHFGLDAIKDLPGLAELKGSGPARQQPAARFHRA